MTGDPSDASRLFWALAGLIARDGDACKLLLLPPACTVFLSSQWERGPIAFCCVQCESVAFFRSAERVQACVSELDLPAVSSGNVPYKSFDSIWRLTIHVPNTRSYREHERRFLRGT